MTTRSPKFVLVLLIGLMAMGSFAHVVSADEELEVLRKAQALINATNRLDSIKKNLEDKGLLDYAITQCGNPPVISAETITSQFGNIGSREYMTSSYNKWINCGNSIYMIESRKKGTEAGLKPIVENIGKLGVESKVNQECGAVPTSPESRTSTVETEKFEIKSNLWISCSAKAIEKARSEIRKQNLFDEVSYFQQRNKELNFAGPLSDVCSNTPQFINFTQDQLSSYPEILEIQKWSECVRRNVKQLIADAEYKKRLEAQTIEKVQKTVGETTKIQEIQKQKVVPAPVMSKPKQEVKEFSVEATASAETAQPVETLIETSEIQTPASKIREIFKNFIKLFRFSR